MTSTASETVWSTMIAVRQLSTTYYTISTCLADILHRYREMITSGDHDVSSSLLNNLHQTLFSSPSSSNKLNDQSRLLAEYANVLHTILQQNSLHTNIIQNVRRLFRSDLLLKQLFTTELHEHCQCQECDCTISNSIHDVIHDVGEIRAKLLVESTQSSCVCFRCGDQQQQKTLAFKQFSPCLALTVNRLNITADDQLVNGQGTIYELTYLIEFDGSSRSILNVYLRQDKEFFRVDGTDPVLRCTTIRKDGKYLTLWLSRSTSVVNVPAPEPVPVTHHDTFLSPPQSASSSSSQVIPSTSIIQDNSLNHQTPDDLPMASDSLIIQDDEDDERFWNSLTDEQSNPPPLPSPSLPTAPDSNSETDSISANDTISDLYLTLLHTTTNQTSPIKSRSEHDRAVKTLAGDILWPLIVDQTNRRNEKKSSSSTATTIQTISSPSSSSVGSSSLRRTTANRYKQLSSTTRSRRAHPYSATTTTQTLPK